MDVFCIIALDRSQCDQLLKTVVAGEFFFYSVAEVVLERRDLPSQLSVGLFLRSDRGQSRSVRSRSNTFRSIKTSEVLSPSSRWRYLCLN
jgi:hypothetical protein